VRGGSCLDATFFTRSDYRAAYACAGRQASCGLRVARTIR
jgi:formylglycine-generating enzyme required for sulfatase activity